MSAGRLRGLTTTLCFCLVDCVAVEPSYGRFQGRFQGIIFRGFEPYFAARRAHACKKPGVFPANERRDPEPPFFQTTKKARNSYLKPHRRGVWVLAFARTTSGRCC